MTGQHVRNTVTYSKPRGRRTLIVHGEGERYVVSAVGGQEIRERGLGGPRTLSLAILDSHYCYRVVWRGSHGRRDALTQRIFKHHELHTVTDYAAWRCDRLNRKERWRGSVA